MANINSDKIKLINLPEKYDLVVGDTFELFYKGIMLCKNPYAYNILVNCSMGKAWGRKFEVTPANASKDDSGYAIVNEDENVFMMMPQNAHLASTCNHMLALKLSMQKQKLAVSQQCLFRVYMPKNLHFARGIIKLLII